MTETQAVSAASRYALLESERQHFVKRADKAAKLTIPTLFMEGTTASKNMDVKDPAQSLGSRGVNTLASKMILSLLPMNTPFFKLNVDALKLQMEGEGEKKAEIEKGLGTIERAVLRDIENSGDVTALFEAVKHLIVVGNVLVYVGKDGSRVFDLNKYVVSRAPDGTVLEIVICEETAPTALTAEQRTTINQNELEKSPDKNIPVYTHVKFEGGKVNWHQEIHGTVVPNSESSVPEKGNPWLALRFLRIDGEDYGRSYVEMYMGDLDSLEVLSTAVRDAAIAASKVIWLVRPNGSTSARVIATANNNDVKTGNADDVTCLRMDKAADLRVAENMLQFIRQQLAAAFMINAEVLRDAERVTAEEVRYVAQELDDSLGGIYSILSSEFQKPYVNRRLHMMRAANRIPKLPSIVDPVIVTGFAALGRGHDREKLIRYAKTIAEVYGPEAVPQFLNADEFNTRLAVADGIDTIGLLITEDDRKAAQAEANQGAQAQEMISKLGPEMIRQAGNTLTQPEGTVQDGT